MEIKLTGSANAKMCFFTGCGEVSVEENIIIANSVISHSYDSCFQDYKHK